MKKLFILFVLAVCTQVASFASDAKTPIVADQFAQMDELQSLSPEMLQLGLQKFTEITPKQYKEITGEKLGLKKTVALKMAQHKVKKAMKDGGGIDKGVYIILAIFGFGWLALGLVSDWEGNDWWVNLLLSIFTCGIGG
jgi:hypothetical protein